MYQNRKPIIFCLFLLSITIVLGMIIEIILHFNTPDDPVKWVADFGDGNDKHIPLGTMERLLGESEQAANSHEQLTLHDKEELLAYLDRQSEVVLPNGLTHHISEMIYLTEMHEIFPVEWISRGESDSQTGRDCIRVVYRVQDREGNIEYVSVFFQDVYSNVYKRFDESNMVYFDGTFPGKPEPDTYLRAAKKIGLKSEECVVFEDGTNGIISAKRAGAAKVICVYEKSLPSPITEEAMPDALYYDFTKWKEIVKDLNISR